MTAFTIQQVSRRSGLSEPTLRYYEEVGLIGPIARDESSGHRRYGDEDLDVLQALACMRAIGVGIEDMRVYQANRARGYAAAAEQRDLLLRHADRIEAEIAAQHLRLDYLREKAALWDARARGDAAAEATAWQRANAAVERLLDLEALRPMKEARGEQARHPAEVTAASLASYRPRPFRPAPDLEHSSGRHDGVVSPCLRLLARGAVCASHERRVTPR